MGISEPVRPERAREKDGSSRESNRKLYRTKQSIHSEPFGWLVAVCRYSFCFLFSEYAKMFILFRFLSLTFFFFPSSLFSAARAFVHTNLAHKQVRANNTLLPIAISVGSVDERYSENSDKLKAKQ